MSDYTITVAPGVSVEPAFVNAPLSETLNGVAASNSPSGEAVGTMSSQFITPSNYNLTVFGYVGTSPSYLTACFHDDVPQSTFNTVTYQSFSGTQTKDFSAATYSLSIAPGYSVFYWATSGAEAANPFLQLGDVTFNVIDSPPSIVQATPTVVSATDVILSWAATVGTNTYAGVFESFSILRNGQVLFDDIDPDVTEWADPTGLPSTEYTYEIRGQYSLGSVSPVVSNDETITTGDMTDEFNCACASVTTYATLASLRQRVLVELGYPNQAANPPPGMAAFINSKLYGAQKLIYKQMVNHGLDTERFFRWTMVPGNRYYALNASEGECTKTLDPLKVTWVGFEDLNQAWYRLTAGIPPEFYTRANINFGWPTHYEIRQCLEIFPAPQAPYTLWVKGHFGLAPFTADGDTATIDDEAVFLLALGNCKMHYGQKDAQVVLKQAGNYIGGMVAGQHGTRRYIPRTKIQNPATPPRFLPLGGGQA